MSMDYNKSVLLGRLARDPEVKTMQSGQKTIHATICCGRQWKDKNTGEKQTHTDFINLSAWGGTADIFEKYVKKGDKILVEGRINTYSYDGKDGSKKYVTEVLVDSLILLGGNKDSAQQQPQQQSYSQPQQPQQQRGDAQDDVTPESLRDEPDLQDEFPLDFSEINGGKSSGGDIKIPF